MNAAVRAAASPFQQLELEEAGPSGLSNGSASRAHRIREQGGHTESEAQSCGPGQHGDQRKLAASQNFASGSLDV